MLPLAIRQLEFAVNQTMLLQRIDLDLRHNGISVIMGHNGAGKSLLLRCMHGLLQPTGGSILWNGKPADDQAVRQKQAMVFQKPLMLNRSVKANIDYVLKLRRKPLRLSTQFLKSAGLDGKEKQPARSLSGGEQQRLAIARALATEPHVLFLDEPTANLDPTATLKIEALVAQVSQQSIKVIMVTHDIAQARRLADDVLFLHQGSLAEYTTAASFFDQPQSVAAQDYLSAYIR